MVEESEFNYCYTDLNFVFSVLAQSGHRDVWGDVCDPDGHPGAGHLCDPHPAAPARE